MREQRLVHGAACAVMLAPASALAHGEEVLLFPVGTLCAIGAVLLLAAVVAVSRPVRIAAVGLALLASLPLWSLPGDALPSFMQHTGWGYFVVGFAPSLVAGALIVWVLTLRKRRANDV